MDDRFIEGYLLGCMRPDLSMENVQLMAKLDEQVMDATTAETPPTGAVMLRALEVALSSAMARVQYGEPHAANAYALSWLASHLPALMAAQQENDALRELATIVAAVKTAWRPDEPDDAQGVAQWRDERQLREVRLRVAEQWGKSFNEAFWFRETREALLELAALAIAQVNSLDDAARLAQA